MKRTFLLVIAAGAVVIAPAQENTASLVSRIDRLEVGVEREEGIRAVKRLQHTFNQYLDAGLWNDLGDLCSDGATAEFGPVKVSGKDAIRKYWMEQAGRTAPGLADGQINTHLILQPIVNLGPDGKAAKGAWHELMMLGNYGKSATWAGGIYENDYVEENGVWKISAIRFFEQYRGAYEEPGQKAPKWNIPYHFESAHVGLTIPASALQTAKTAGKAADNAGRIARLATRLDRMNDETAVHNLQHSYGYYIDRKLWDDAADLFTPEGSFESGQRGVYMGKAQIRKALEALYGASPLKYGELFDHVNMGTVVTVSPDGRKAGARTVELSQIGLNQEYARWELGVYENEFVKQDGIWKIQALHYYPRTITDYDQGWGKAVKPAPGVSKDLAPNHPPSVVYEIYPKYSFPAFDYANPVTGKTVAYPAGVIKGVSMVPTASVESRARATAPKSAGEVEPMLAKAEVELARTIGVDATENLNSSYGYYLDENNWDGMADTFAKVGGAKELTGVGVYVGQDRIRQALKLRGPNNGRSATFYTIHQLTQPVIDVAADGMTAKARFRLFQGGGNADGSGSSWIGGIYENTAIFENGEWKFGIQDLHHSFNASYKNGWAKFPARNAQPAQGKQQAKGKAPAPNRVATEMAPDRAIRARQYAFPEIVEPAFHYKNPVTGRMPGELLP